MAEQNTNNILNLVKAICTRVKEKESVLTKTKLLKYLYLIDIEYYKNHNETFTGFKWIFYHFGPWTSEYDEVYKVLANSYEFQIKQYMAIDIESDLIESNDKVYFESVFKDTIDGVFAKRITDRWVDEKLGPMLDYVYFYTEPMVDAQRGEILDFTKINSLEKIPESYLSESTATVEQLNKFKNILREKIKEKGKIDNRTITPPKYDDFFWKETEKLDNDNDY